MNKKLLLTFLLILVSVCALFNVSAADDSDIIASDNSTDIQTQIIDETLSEDNAEETQTDDNYLKAEDTAFREIQYKIDNAEEGAEIILEGNYTGDYLINVNKSITIRGAGDGAVINYNGSTNYRSPFFNINSQASKVVLDNIKFVGGVFLWGGAITWQGDDGTIKNCQFLDNAATGENAIGGAILVLGKNCKIDNCIFKNNRAFKYGGAVICNGIGCEINNCEFSDNFASDEQSHGGALVFWADNCLVNNSKFTNNHCTDYGGAISILKENITVQNCEFYNNYITNKFYENLTQGGGAIYSYNSNGSVIDNCSFIGNHASEAFGGAISLFLDNVVKNSFFKLNYAYNGNDLYYYCPKVISNHFVLDYGETLQRAVTMGIPDFELLKLGNTFNRTKINSSVIFTPGLIFEYGSSGSIQVSVDGGTIDVKNITVLNHDEAKITYSKNVLTISNLDVGEYVLRVTTTPDENHTSVDGYLNFTVKKATAVLKASKLTVALKSATEWKITLVDSRNNKPISNMKITLKVYTGTKYKTVPLTTNSKGVASYKTKDLAAGNHKIVVSASHKGYNFNTLTSSIKVVKQTPLKFKVRARVNGKDGSLLSYLVFNKNTNKGINGVKFKVLIYTGKNYKTYTLTTKKIKDKKKTFNGAIGFSTNDFSAGKHTVKFIPVDIKYKGSVTTSITIKKTATKGPKFFRKI